MEKIRPYLIGAALAAVVILGMAQAVEPQDKRWQYLYVEQQWVKFEPIDLRNNGARLVQSKVLNDLGNDGRELVQSGVGGYLFRRPVR